MLVLGHLGIGSKLVSPWSRELPLRAVLLGTILPDLIDKPLYYGFSLATGRISGDIGLVSCTRTFGHTAILLLLVTLVALAKKSKFLAALALGMATHLLLDNLTDSMTPGSQHSALTAMLWPVLAARFAFMPTDSLKGYLEGVFTPFLIGSEIVGLALLGWDAWKTRHESEILAFMRERRRALKLFKRGRSKRPRR